MKNVSLSLTLLAVSMTIAPFAVAKNVPYDSAPVFDNGAQGEQTIVAMNNADNSSLAETDRDGMYLETPHADTQPQPANIAWREARSVPPSDQGDMQNASTVTMTQTKTTPMEADREADIYGIEPGDVLQVSVWKEDALDREVIVLPDGKINFPLIGTINVLNKTPEQVQVDIKERLRKFVPDASVSVVVKADLGHTVSVIGQVVKPGELIMSHHLSVMMALSQAGGLTPYAKQSRVLILRRGADGKETAIRFPYGDVVDGDDLDKDIYLQPGDVVVVPTAGLF